MTAPGLGSRAGKRKQPMPAPHQMGEVHRAKDRLADLEERIIRGEPVDASEYAAAEASVRLAAKEGEVAERARRRAKQTALEAAAAEGEAWLAQEAPVLAAAALEAMAAAVDASRLLVAALADYQSGADRAMAAINRVRHAPTHWPAGRGLVDNVFDEVKAAALGRAVPTTRTPISQQFSKAVGAARAAGSGLLPAGSGGTGPEQ